MASVFLSYSRDDVERIRPIAAALEKAGHDVWWDRRIGGGQEFSGAIEEALESSQAVVVAWSQSAVKSAWVRDEAGHGRDTKHLIPVTLDGCLPPLGFRQYQTIDLSNGNGRATSPALEPLLEAVANCGDAQPAERATPARRAASPLRSRRAWQAAIVAAFVFLLLIGAGVIYPHFAESGPISPKVALGQFALTSPDLPRQLPQQIGQEILAAFGAENAVAVVAAPGGSRGGAPFVMDGTISKEGATVRYTVNLKDSSSGVLLWSDGYDRSASDAIAPRQVAVQASQVVRCGLWGAAAYKRRMSGDALSLYLKWCNEHWSGSGDDTAELDAARAVTAAVPDFSFGWSALALAAVPLAQDSSAADARQMAGEAREAAERSIKLDDQNPEGYMALAGLLPLSEYAKREELLKKAISVRRLECGCERLSYGDFLSSVGRVDDALDEYQRGQAKMPLAPFSNIRLAQALYMVGRHEEADRMLGEVEELWPDASDVGLLKIKSAFWSKRYDQALAALGSPELRLGRQQRDALVAAFEALKSGAPGRRAEAISLLRQCAGDPKANDRLVVAALAALGEKDAAIAGAQRLIASRGYRYADVLFEPNLASAAQSPAYAALVNQLGLAGYWRTPATEPDICNDPARPSFCAAA
jgi:tetratricopeptide (TPR) repeat protein